MALLQNRDSHLQSLSQQKTWDLVVIGGGATGVGVALDAASRGYTVALLEQSDFGKGTSSRSTKLIHGGVRYLAQGNIGLVREALHERTLLLRNAPHLVHRLSFIIPARSWLNAAYYRAGIAMYDLLAGSAGLGESALLSRDEALRELPGLRGDSASAGVRYYDCQFDDSRLLISLAGTAANFGASLVNYAPVRGLLQSQSGAVQGVAFQDLESGRTFEVQSRVVINATGAFSDGVRRMARGYSGSLVTASQGSHVVVDRSFLPSESALLVPKTSDGRVLFAIPWHGHTLLGTTDVPTGAPALDPVPSAAEIDFILETAGQYLARAPRRLDVLSVFAGIRPLVAAGAGSTSRLSRDHSIHADSPGLITIVGGKWTTYRKMAQDCVDLACKQAGLPLKPCRTEAIRVSDYGPADSGGYGSDAQGIQRLIEEDPELGQFLHRDYSYTAAEVVWAVRHEMARTVEDVLARRMRLLFLNAAAASESAAAVAPIIAGELRRDAAWALDQVQEFRKLAVRYELPERSSRPASP